MSKVKNLMMDIAEYENIPLEQVNQKEFQKYSELYDNASKRLKKPIDQISFSDIDFQKKLELKNGQLKLF